MEENIDLYNHLAWRLDCTRQAGTGNTAGYMAGEAMQGENADASQMLLASSFLLSQYTDVEGG